LADTPAPEPVAARDFLADVLAVMAGADRVKSVDILQRLKENWPAAYDEWSSQDFADALKPFGVEIKQGRVNGEAGQRYVAGDDIRHAMEHPALTDGNS
jgi:hypothetical protein